MRTLLLLIALAICFCLGPQASAQSVDSVFMSSRHDHWGHTIIPTSFTFKSQITLGPLPSMSKLLERRSTGSWEIMSFQNLNSNGIDQFDITFPYDALWDVRLTYSGSGWMKMLIIEDINPKNVPVLGIVQLQINGAWLYVTAQCTRYDQGETDFDTHIELELYNTDIGCVVDTLLEWVNPAGSPVATGTYSFYLPPIPGGWLCATARLLYSHNDPGGFSDFQYALVANTNGNNCISWIGLPTVVNDFLNLSVLEKNEEVVVYSVTGQVMMRGSVKQGINTSSWQTGIYIASFVPKDGKEYSHKFFVGH